MSVHAFVDESKRRGLVLAAALVDPAQVAATRGLIRSLRMPRQARIHFNNERNSRRRQILAAICGSGVVVHIYDATSIADDREARAACLFQLVVDLSELGGQRLVVEQEDSMLRSDRQVLYDARLKAGAEDLTYVHLRPSAEPLLWIPDAASWCWTQAAWRHRIQPVVTRVWRP